jgi:hypothetical protein
MGSAVRSSKQESNMSKPLNITDEDRAGVRVTFNVNRFEVYHRDGWLMTAANDKASLKEQLSANRIKGAMFDGVAQRKYLAA